MNTIAHLIASMTPGKSFRYAWNSKFSKNPNHLSFNKGAQISYMRDGILTLSDGSSGTYERIKEFAGPDRDSHEVTMSINARIWDGETELS